MNKFTTDDINRLQELVQDKLSEKITDAARKELTELDDKLAEMLGALQ